MLLLLLLSSLFSELLALHLIESKLCRQACPSMLHELQTRIHDIYTDFEVTHAKHNKTSVKPVSSTTSQT